jgi:hypothetical protein
VAEEEEFGATITADRSYPALVFRHGHSCRTVLEALALSARVNQTAQNESRSLTFAYAPAAARSCRLQKKSLTQALVSYGQTLIAVDLIADWHCICFFYCTSLTVFFQTTLIVTYISDRLVSLGDYRVVMVQEEHAGSFWSPKDKESEVSKPQGS